MLSWRTAAPGSRKGTTKQPGHTRAKTHTHAERDGKEDAVTDEVVDAEENEKESQEGKEVGEPRIAFVLCCGADEESFGGPPFIRETRANPSQVGPRGLCNGPGLSSVPHNQQMVMLLKHQRP